MKISKSFQGKIFGDFINDLFRNHNQFIIPFLIWENGEDCIIYKGFEIEDNERLYYTNADDLRYFLKCFDKKYPKYKKGEIDTNKNIMKGGEPYSFKDIEQKQLIDHLEYYRLVLAHNGKSFKSDLEEWDRMIKMYCR